MYQFLPLLLPPENRPRYRWRPSGSNSTARPFSTDLYKRNTIKNKFLSELSFLPFELSYDTFPVPVANGGGALQEAVAEVSLHIGNRPSADAAEARGGGRNNFCEIKSKLQCFPQADRACISKIRKFNAASTSAKSCFVNQLPSSVRKASL